MEMEKEPQRGLPWPPSRNRGKMVLAGAEDRAMLESNPSADTGDGAMGAEPIWLCPLRLPVAPSKKR